MIKAATAVIIRRHYNKKNRNHTAGPWLSRLSRLSSEKAGLPGLLRHAFYGLCLDFIW